MNELPVNWPVSFISELPVDFCINLLNFFVFGDVMEEHHPSISTIDNNTVLYRDNNLFVLPFLPKLSYNIDRLRQHNNDTRIPVRPDNG